MYEELLRLYVHEFPSRKKEVVYLVSQGLSNDAVGDRLCLASETVADYLTEIYGKMSTLPSLANYDRINRHVTICLFAVFFHLYPELKPPCQ